jgi:hypothetical protein
MPTSSIARPSKIYPNWDFWFENIQSGNTDFGAKRTISVSDQRQHLRVSNAQCDQVGRIFAIWAMVHFARLFENCTKFVATEKCLVFVLTKYELGCALGDFLTVASGHPGWHPSIVSLH